MDFPQLPIVKPPPSASRNRLPSHPAKKHAWLPREKTAEIREFFPANVFSR